MNDDRAQPPLSFFPFSFSFVLIPNFDEDETGGTEIGETMTITKHAYSFLFPFPFLRLLLVFKQMKIYIHPMDNGPTSPSTPTLRK